MAMSIMEQRASLGKRVRKQMRVTKPSGAELYVDAEFFVRPFAPEKDRVTLLALDVLERRDPSPFRDIAVAPVRGAALAVTELPMMHVVPESRAPGIDAGALRWQDAGILMTESRGMRGMGDLIDIALGPWKYVYDKLAPKSDAWFANLDRIQKDLTVLNAELNAIGSVLWNMTMEYDASPAGQNRIIEWRPWYNFKFDAIQSYLTDRLKKIIVTQDYVPSDFEIDQSRQAFTGVRRLIDLVKTGVPAVGALSTVQAAKADMETRMAGITPLKNPVSAGVKAFVDTLKERAEKLGQWGLGLGVVAAVVAAIVLASRMR
jgi:hypothetical protein